jgi:hypothetical protein
MSIPTASHRFGEFFGVDASRVFRVTFRDGMILRLVSFSVVAPSIYAISDQWTATVVESVAGRSFRPSVGLDFVESDVVEIVDESSAQIVYP